MLIDVDDFKKINDTYGHLYGDVVLKTVAQLLAGQLRSADLIARFGGDEFVVILPETTQERARVVAERIEQATSTHPAGNVPLAVSIGVATFRPGLTPEHLLEESDQDLYRQKGSSRRNVARQEGAGGQVQNTISFEI